MPRQWISRHRVAILLSALLLFGFALRVYSIGAKSLWFDEAMSVYHAERPLAETLEMVSRDVHPPLYHLLLHFWLHLGDDEATIRLLSAFCGTLNVFAMYLLGEKLGGSALGLAAALILASSPFHVAYGQEARMYALLSLNATLAAYFMARLLTDPRAAAVTLGGRLLAAGRWAGRRLGQGAAGQEGEERPSLAALEPDLSWGGYMAFTAAALLTHNTAVFLPLAINLFVLGWLLVRYAARSRRSGGGPVAGQPVRIAPGPSSRFLCNWLAAQLGVLVLWASWLPTAIGQSTRVYSRYWIQPPTWQTVCQTWWALSSYLLPQRPPFEWLAPLFFGACAGLGLLYFRRQPRWPGLLLLLMLAPVAGEFCVSQRRPIYLTRTLIWASIPYYLLLAGGFLQLAKCRLLPIAMAGLLALNGLSLHRYYVHYEKEPWRTVAAYVAERADGDDLILFCAPYVRVPFDYYFRRYGKTVAEVGVQVESQAESTLGPPAQGLDEIETLIGERKTVWLVYNRSDLTDPEGRVRSLLASKLRLAKNKGFRQVRVLRYER